MKIKILSVVMAAALVLLAGCQSGSSVPRAPSSAPEPPTSEQADENLKQFVTLLSDSWVLADSWNKADDIRADAFPAFYYRAALLPKNPNGWSTAMQVPADEFEEEIAKYFDVSTEHLRTVKNYDAAANCYSFEYGIGSGAKLDVNSVAVNGAVTTVSFTQYDLGENPTQDGEVQLKESGDSYKVLSCSVNAVVKPDFDF